MLAIFLAALGSASTAVAYPIDPVSLTELCARADLIAIVVPGPTRARTPIPGEWIDSSETDLAPKLLLKGSYSNSYCVRYTPGMICPRPPIYDQGVRTLAFLYLAQDGAYQTVGLSYGTKQLTEAEELSYQACIREILHLQGMPVEDWRAGPEYLEWVVRCAEDPNLIDIALKETRKEKESSRLRSRNEDGEDEEATKLKPISERLNSAQLMRIARAIEAEPRMELIEWGIVKYLEDVPNFPVDQLVFEALTDGHAEKTWVTKGQLDLLAKRWDDPILVELAKDYRAALKSDPDGYFPLVERLQTYRLLHGK